MRDRGSQRMFEGVICLWITPTWCSAWTARSSSRRYARAHRGSESSYPAAGARDVAYHREDEDNYDNESDEDHSS